MGYSQTLQYLIDNEQDACWGLTVNGVGFQHIDSGEIYPPKNHYLCIANYIMHFYL